MFKGLGNIASLLKQAQSMGPRMQAQMEALSQERVIGSAGAGLVSVEADGTSRILSVTIDPVLAEKQDIEMISDLLPTAINDALAKARQLHMEAMQSLTDDLPMPGNMEQMLGKILGSADGDDSPADR